jgi:hypothetical protein
MMKQRSLEALKQTFFQLEMDEEKDVADTAEAKKHQAEA